MRQYIGYIRDHSNSMLHLRDSAKQDYNELIRETKESFISMPTTVSVIECGIGRSSEVRVKETNIPIGQLNHINTYEISGYGTPLYDSVGGIIELLTMADNLSHDKDSAFLVIVVTDGEENSSKIWNSVKLRNEITKLQATDRWTFVFRVPKGYKTKLVNRLGVHEGNVVEWEQSEKGYDDLTQITTSGMQSYSNMRSSGYTSTDKFYVNLTELKTSDIKRNLVDISHLVSYHDVVADNSMFFASEIRPYVEDVLRLNFVIGSVYYELTKTETIQANKSILIRNKLNGNTYTGEDAKSLIGLPFNRSTKVTPGQFGEWQIFIQSTSVNRKLVNGTKIAIYNK